MKYEHKMYSLDEEHIYYRLQFRHERDKKKNENNLD